MYKLLRTLLFLFPPESVHHFSMHVFRLLCKVDFLKKLIASKFDITYQKPGLFSKKVFGLTFKNQVGLAAGFDKNALYLEELQVLGFGFIEIGTVTPVAQKGNELPRLFRLTRDKALINRMGFNNDGVKIIAERLRTYKKRNPGSDLIIGGNIGKNKITPNADAWQDYEICFRELFDCVDYFVVNVSSPNTPGLRELQEKEALRKILSHLQMINSEQPLSKPLLLKIAPDLTQSQTDDVIELALEIKLDGLVATNTTLSRENLRSAADRVQKIGAGGLSGAPLQGKSTEMVRYIHQQTDGSIPIIASGGIFNAEDVTEKIIAGASLIQVWTGFIYEGPAIVKNILSPSLSKSTTGNPSSDQ